MSNTRRQFLKSAVLGAAGASVAGCATAGTKDAAAKLASKADALPRRVIFLVSDGMSVGVPSLAEPFSHVARSGQGTHWYALLQDSSAAQGLFETHSLNSLVTDSAAASSAWGSGSRVFNRAVNVLPDGTPLKPILALLKEKGIGTGLVTTSTITHATPAGFASSEPHRDKEDLIGPQYLNRVDVLLGGGRKFFDSTLRKDGRDLFGEFTAAGYARLADRDAVLAAAKAPSAKMIGLFSDGHLPYTIDHREDAALRASTPTLAEMTSAALATLEANPNGFLLQVEGARIDHAAHANDTAAALWDQLAFDDAVGVALDFARRHPDTLVVVTSDHGNSNPGLNGINSEYEDSTKFFARVALAKGSVGMVEKRLAGETPATPEAAQQAVREVLGIELNAEEAATVAKAAAKQPVPELNDQLRKFVGILGQVVGNHTGVGWTGTTHTADWTLISAKGPGQELFGHAMKNTDAFVQFTRIFGIDFRNPSMTPEQAQQHASAARLGAAAKDDWA